MVGGTRALLGSIVRREYKDRLVCMPAMRNVISCSIITQNKQYSHACSRLVGYVHVPEDTTRPYEVVGHGIPAVRQSGPFEVYSKIDIACSVKC